MGPFGNPVIRAFTVPQYNLANRVTLRGGFRLTQHLDELGDIAVLGDALFRHYKQFAYRGILRERHIFGNYIQWTQTYRRSAGLGKRVGRTMFTALAVMASAQPAAPALYALALRRLAQVFQCQGQLRGAFAKGWLPEVGYGVYVMSASLKGVSLMKLHRDIGVAKKKMA